MIWFVTEENGYYSSDTKSSIKMLVDDAMQAYPHLKKEKLTSATQNILYMPSIEEIRKAINAKHDGKNADVSTLAIVSPQTPTDYNFLPMGFFTEITLRGRHFPYTVEQIDLNIDKAEVISKRTGLKIVKPQMTLDDLAGADALIKDVKRMLLLEKQGMFSISGLFLFGVAGAGKTFFAETFAGTTGRRFVILDLPHFMSLPSPTRALDEVFDFLLSQKNERYLLLIDEIEKMFDFTGGNLVATQVFGKLLTRLNDIYSLEDNNIAFVATANNIAPIMSNNPEFLRKGRFNRLYFMNYPSYKSAAKIFEIYKKKNRKRVEKALKKQYKNKSNPLLNPFFDAIKSKEITFSQLLDFIHFDFESGKVVTSVNEFYSSNKKSGKSFIYVPPEIQAVAEELQNEYLLFLLSDENKKNMTVEKVKSGERIDVPDIYQFSVDIAKTIVPLQVSAAEGVGKQLAQAKSFGSGEQIEQFIEIS